MTRSEGMVASALKVSKACKIVDISDLVYYLGHHDHLTGIQRVQASLVLEFLTDSSDDSAFVAYEPATSSFLRISEDVLGVLLDDLMLPTERRQMTYDRHAARGGRLPDSVPFVHLSSRASRPCILLLGAAWVIPDYFRHINILRDEIDATFACVVHDLIPIYARETCDQGTADVFKSFLATSRFSTELYVCVSENTRRDLVRYFNDNGWPAPRATVITNATAVPSTATSKRPSWFSDDSNGFVLSVSTIEGRKNHPLLYNTWRRLMIEHPDKTPKLICVGRPGWRCEDFLLQHLASNGLGGKIEIWSDVSDSELTYLYQECRFTLYPSFYEGWGLPIAESLAYGKFCICSNTSSMPEVGGDLVGYIDPYNGNSAYDQILETILYPARVAAAEQRIADEFQTRRWSQVAADYGQALLALGLMSTRCIAPEAPAHFVFRSPRADVRGALGSAMIERVTEHLRSDLRPGAVALDTFDNGHLSRSKGTWFTPEPWGSWIGFAGATISFETKCREEMYVYLSYQVMSPFAHQRLKIVINTTPTFVTMGDANGYKIFILKFMPTNGRNNITFVGSTTAAQRENSMAIDGRGLMIGIREMVILPKSDIESRLELMQALLPA